MKQTTMQPEFVTFIPEELNEGVIYVSDQYKTASHKCCCGCGNEVVTALTTADWSYRLNGGEISLYPSIGNWSFKCQSHYWIRNNKIIWAKGMTPVEIAKIRHRDWVDKKVYIASMNAKKSNKTGEGVGRLNKAKVFILTKLKHWLGL